MKGFKIDVNYLTELSNYYYWKKIELNYWLLPQNMVCKIFVGKSYISYDYEHRFPTLFEVIWHT